MLKRRFVLFYDGRTCLDIYDKNLYMPLFEYAESDFEISIFDQSVHLPTQNPHKNDEKSRNCSW